MLYVTVTVWPLEFVPPEVVVAVLVQEVPQTPPVHI
jgi:hypothetical protein